ncbi:virulence RhuM family protein [Ferribacterium limneticum]|uniref:virulence RhuM family protein n=1 Tax=Ferribacterium limneticum TaxID=76259 RepID=UPI001CFA3471|nr:virulence RhuM family protein [Ferribacterium limneticum]UCV29475.1 virulence RhuM family protein [Ferribacterium limneticum]UCV33394.1 virulence RhuM family protein [Ferribacterium limneticum]
MPELILYTTEDGQTSIKLRAEDGTVWLSQQEMAELFASSKQNISHHVRAILAEGEQSEATVKSYLTVQNEGSRSVRRKTMMYSLPLILAVGYRVRSARGTQFRQWATRHLNEFLVKGFVMDDARLKDPAGWDYFDELLARIRDIRASEKHFYQKVRDIYATAVDYDSKSEAAQLFFKKVQNKMLWAITGQTAAELIAARADASAPDMGLTTWAGAQVRQKDVTIAKNYLNAEEIDELNRIVTMYLEFAEDQARRRKSMTMADWAGRLDAFLDFNEREVLTHAGKLSAEVAEKLALERYETFATGRRQEAVRLADTNDLQTLEALQKRGLTHGNDT